MFEKFNPDCNVSSADDSSGPGGVDDSGVDIEV
jgi:hypothetical protein